MKEFIDLILKMFSKKKSFLNLFKVCEYIRSLIKILTQQNEVQI